MTSLAISNIVIFAFRLTLWVYSALPLKVNGDVIMIVVSLFLNQKKEKSNQRIQVIECFRRYFEISEISKVVVIVTTKNAPYD